MTVKTITVFIMATVKALDSFLDCSASNDGGDSQVSESRKHY